MLISKHYQPFRLNQDAYNIVLRIRRKDYYESLVTEFTRRIIGRINCIERKLVYKDSMISNLSSYENTFSDFFFNLAYERIYKFNLTIYI